MSRSKKQKQPKIDEQKPELDRSDDEGLDYSQRHSDMDWNETERTEFEDTGFDEGEGLHNPNVDKNRRMKDKERDNIE
jgi:hypothetical protein